MEGGVSLAPLRTRSQGMVLVAATDTPVDALWTGSVSTRLLNGSTVSPQLWDGTHPAAVGATCHGEKDGAGEAPAEGSWLARTWPEDEVAASGNVDHARDHRQR